MNISMGNSTPNKVTGSRRKHIVLEEETDHYSNILWEILHNFVYVQSFCLFVVSFWVNFRQFFDTLINKFGLLLLFQIKK